MFVSVVIDSSLTDVENYAESYNRYATYFFYVWVFNTIARLFHWYNI